MTYVLEKITTDEKEKIVLDAENQIQVKKDLLYRLTINSFPKSWAVNRDKNLYLFYVSALVREDSTNRNYCFYFNGVFHKFSLEGLFGNKVVFADSSVKNLEEISKLEKEIADALAVHGDFGLL